MIKDLLVSFKDNIQTKTSNPFFGTLILVWLTSNWNLFYTLFNFEKNTTLEAKKEFIINHFTNLPLIENLLWCILEAFIVLIISYLLLNLSRLIINFNEKRITPLLYKWTDEKSIVLKTVYDASENERKRLEKRVEEEREARLKLHAEYENLENRIAELLTQKKDPISNEKSGEVSTVRSDSENKSPTIDKMQLLFDKLIKENKITEFELIASDILNYNSINKYDGIVKDLVTMGLIVPGNQLSGNRDFYNLTPIGKDIHEKLILQG